MGKKQLTPTSSDEKICITADGAYSGDENTKLAKEKNVELITTTLSGKETPDVFADFTYNEDGTKLESCAAGYAPQKCSYRKSTGQIIATFFGEACLNCPHKRECNPKTSQSILTCIWVMVKLPHGVVI